MDNGFVIKYDDEYSVLYWTSEKGYCYREDCNGNRRRISEKEMIAAYEYYRNY